MCSHIQQQQGPWRPPGSVLLSIGLLKPIWNSSSLQGEELLTLTPLRALEMAATTNSTFLHFWRTCFGCWFVFLSVTCYFRESAQQVKARKGQFGPRKKQVSHMIVVKSSFTTSLLLLCCTLWWGEATDVGHCWTDTAHSCPQDHFPCFVPFKFMYSNINTSWISWKGCWKCLALARET